MSADRADAVRGRASWAVLVVTLLVYVAVALVVLLVGPDEVVGHFGADGQPNRYDATGPFVLTLSLVVAAIVGLFAAIRATVPRIPIQWVNVPQREKWNTPARRRVLARRLGADLHIFAALTVLLMTVILAASALAGAGLPLPAWIFVTATLVFLALVLAHTIAMLASGRYNPDLLPD